MLLRFDPTRPTATLLPVDVVRGSTEVTVTLDVPGVDPDAIEVSVDRHVLTVTTERPAPAVAEGERVVAAERSRGRQVRRLTLGETVDAGAISATVDKGVLTLHLPVTEAAKPRRIDVAPAGVAVTAQPQPAPTQPAEASEPQTAAA